MNEVPNLWNQHQVSPAAGSGIHFRKYTAPSESYLLHSNQV